MNDGNPDVERIRQRLDASMRIPRNATFPSLSRPETFYVYADAYRLAAERLIKSFWPDTSIAPTPDHIVMPILYLIHHCVELELKEIVRLSYLVGYIQGQELSNLPKGGSHSLSELLEMAESNLKELFPGEAPLLCQGLSEIIDDLEKFSSKGEALRYPEQISGDPTLSESYVADVPAVMKALEPVRKRFDGAIGCLIDMWDNL